MLKNALMENVKLMIRNNHQSLSSKSQILTGKERIKRKKQLKLQPRKRQLKLQSRLRIRQRIKRPSKKLRKRKKSKRNKSIKLIILKLLRKNKGLIQVYSMPRLKKRRTNQRLVQDGHTKSKILRKSLSQPKKTKRLHISQFQRRLLQALLEAHIQKQRLLIIP